MTPERPAEPLHKAVERLARIVLEAYVAAELMRRGVLPPPLEGGPR